MQLSAPRPALARWRAGRRADGSLAASAARLGPLRSPPAAVLRPAARPVPAAHHASLAPVNQRRPAERVRAAAAAGAAASPEPVPAPAGLFAKKVAALSLIFVGGTINYTVLQSVRDAMIVTSCGAEALPFISAFGVLPASLLFIVYFDRLVASLDSRHVFYAALAPMAAFYALFAAVLLPNAAALHPTALAEQYIARLPESLSCLVRVCCNWTFSLYFILGELWGSVAISLLFWSLADDVCSVDEAKGVYPKLGILANVGLIAAGSFTRWVSSSLARSNEVLGLQILTGSVLVITLLMCLVKAYMDAQVLPYVGAHAPRRSKKKHKAEEGGKPEAKQSTLDTLRSSPRILNLTMLVVGYGVTHKLFGFLWKSQIRTLYPSQAAYATVMADIASYTGVVTISLMLVSKWVFQYMGWRGAALVTPLVCTISGATFLFGSLVPPGSAPPGSALAALLLAAPAAGIVAQVFGRAAKYSLFDPSKEMVFITMQGAEKEKGKAAVDVLGNQIGKTGGSWVMQAALLTCGSMAGALPFTAVFYVGTCVLWLRATLSLARSMEGKEEEQAVLASIDGTPLCEAPAPGKLRLDPRASAAFAAAGAAAGAAAPSQLQVEQEVKQSMQSHFD